MTQTPQPKRLKIPNNFDRSSVKLIREMEDYGWHGRNTVNGHVFMCAPDGETTASIVPDVDAQWRTSLNQLAPYRRWLKEHKAEVKAARKAKTAAEAVANDIQIPAAQPEPEPTAPVDTQPEPDRLVCGQCPRDFATLQALSVHVVRAHVRVSCQFCGDQFSPGNLPRHEENHRNDGKTADDLRREVFLLRQQMERIIADRDDWQDVAEDTERRMVALKSNIRVMLGD
jgi:hypothetical protein